MTAGHGNRRAGDAFKQAVALHLIDHGHVEARPNRPTKISEALRLPGDISGLPVVMTVRSGQEVKLSDLLAEAGAAGAMTGKPAVAVHSRRGYPVGESYACMTLDAFAELLHLMGSQPSG